MPVTNFSLSDPDYVAAYQAATRLGLSPGILAKALLLCFLEGEDPSEANIIRRAQRSTKEVAPKVRGPF